MSLLHTLHLHFDWNIVCWHTAHIYTDAFDSLHKSVNNFLSEEQRGQMCPLLSSVCLRVLVQMLLLFQQSAHLGWLYSSKKNNLFPSCIFIPQHTLQQAQKLPTLKAAEKRCWPNSYSFHTTNLLSNTLTFNGWLFGSASNRILTPFIKSRKRN